MNRWNRRQVLECGDEACAVAALATLLPRWRLTSARVIQRCDQEGFDHRPRTVLGHDDDSLRGQIGRWREPQQRQLV